MPPSFIHTIKNNLSAKLILAAVTLIIGTTLALNYYFYVQQKEKLTDNLLFHGRSLAKILAHDSRLGIFTGDPLELKTRANLILEEQDCTLVVIFDLTGRPLIRLDSAGRSLAAPVSSSLDSQTLFKKIPELLSAQSPLFSKEKAIVLVEEVAITLNYSEEALFMEDAHLQPVSNTPLAIAKKTEPIGFVAVVMSTDGIQQKALGFLRQSTIVSLAITLISCALIFLVIQSLTLPLRNLTREIDRHQRTFDPNAQAAPPQSDFQGMIATIKESFQTIEELKNNLEQQVRNRTLELKASNKELAAQKIDLEGANSELVNTLQVLRTTQDQLIQSEKMAALGQLISGLSHEIYNSINFIATSLPLLEKNIATLLQNNPSAGPDTPESGRLVKASTDTKTLLSNIKEGVRRITGVVNDLRVFSYHKADSFEMTDIRKGLTASISILRHEHQSRIDFREEFAENLPLAEVRGGQINQVFMNILLNAVQAIPKTGTITIKVWSTAECIHTSIADSGCGIDRRRLTRIFDPFYTTKEVGMGTGMGLSLSYSIVQKHNGQIKVDSTPEKGTIFEIILPLKHTRHQNG